MVFSYNEPETTEQPLLLPSPPPLQQGMLVPLLSIGYLIGILLLLIQYPIAAPTNHLLPIMCLTHLWIVCYVTSLVGSSSPVLTATEGHLSSERWRQLPSFFGSCTLLFGLIYWLVNLLCFGFEMYSFILPFHLIALVPSHLLLGCCLGYLYLSIRRHLENNSCTGSSPAQESVSDGAIYLH